VKIGLVLSGGGARGVAHIGVLRALNDLGIRPAIISGVSSGALVGALYCAHYSPARILGLVQAHASSSLVKMMFMPGGLFSSAGIRQIITSLIPEDDFEHLSTPLIITATDINQNESVAFEKGTLHQIVTASCSIPGIFNPIYYEGRCLVDGGILNNLPVSCIKDRCDSVIGVHVNKLYVDDCRSVGRAALIDKCIHLAVSVNVAANISQCDVFIEPDLHHHSMFDLKDAEAMYEAGYKSVMEKKAELKSLVVKS
jgi:NTE family protein